MGTVIADDPAVLDQIIGGRRVRDYTLPTEDDLRCCDGHQIDNLAGYVVRRTVCAGRVLERPAGWVGVDVHAMACAPDWGNYDKAVEYACRLRVGGCYAVVDRLYRCGHRFLA